MRSTTDTYAGLLSTVFSAVQVSAALLASSILLHTFVFSKKKNPLVEAVLVIGLNIVSITLLLAVNIPIVRQINNHEHEAPNDRTDSGLTFSAEMAVTRIVNISLYVLAALLVLYSLEVINRIFI